MDDINNVNLNIPDIHELTPLMWAAARNNPQLTAEILALPGVNPNATDWRGNTALHYAVMARQGDTNGAYDVTRLLLGHDGVDISKRNNTGLTASMMANGICPLLKEKLFQELTKRRLAVLSCTKYKECVLLYEVLKMIAEYLHLQLPPQ
jgi:hypothetical protein